MYNAQKVFLRTAGCFFALLLFLSSLSLPASAEISRTNLLRTTLNPEAYSLFEISGNTIIARGKYVSDRLTELSVLPAQLSSYSFSAHEDGSFEAELTCLASRTENSLVMTFSSGRQLSYPLYFDGSGLYFPQNGLAAANAEVFDKIHDCVPRAAGLYLSASGSKEKITEVQQQVRQISDSVTDGIDSDYDKARALAGYVSAHIYYDYDARNTGVTEETISIENTLKNGRTVCAGFANLYCALLQAQGIDAVNIKGGSTGGKVTYQTLTDGVQNHEFTAFYCEEQSRWVWVDSCWNGSGRYEGGEFYSSIQHEKYFDITDAALSFDHRADYAERRSFFEAEPYEKDERTAETSAQTTVPDEAVESKTSETTETAETAAAATLSEAAAAGSEGAVNAQRETEAAAVTEQDNTPLIIAAILLGAGIIALIFIIGRNRKNGSN